MLIYKRFRIDKDRLKTLRIAQNRSGSLFYERPFFLAIIWKFMANRNDSFHIKALFYLIKFPAFSCAF